MNNNDLFEKAPISKAYFKLALPVVKHGYFFSL